MGRTTNKGGALRIRRKVPEKKESSGVSTTTVPVPVNPVVDPVRLTRIAKAPEPTAPWHAADAAVVGTAHLRTNPPKPCQDAALTDVSGRPLLVLADGAGSAAVSHFGASAVVAGVRRLCRTLEYDMATLLDSDDSPTGQGKSIANKIVTHAIGVLSDLADLQQRGIDDFRCTLLVWIGGNRRALWLKVGDGALVAEEDSVCRCIGPLGKGEFANQTCFIGPHLDESQWAWGELNSAQLFGMAAMSDGAAERLVSSDSSRVSVAMGKLLRGVAAEQIGRRDIFGLLAEADFWKGTSGDDKSLALVARRAHVETT
jgi:hypothetical protein